MNPNAWKFNLPMGVTDRDISPEGEDDEEDAPSDPTDDSAEPREDDDN